MLFVASSSAKLPALGLGGRAVTLFASILIVLLIAVSAPAAACKGCGCRGGPGWRDAAGECVGWARMKKACGDPPDSARCTNEGANNGESDAVVRQTDDVGGGSAAASSGNNSDGGGSPAGRGRRR
jgi:hypothetical protein